MLNLCILQRTNIYLDTDMPTTIHRLPYTNLSVVVTEQLMVSDEQLPMSEVIGEIIPRSSSTLSSIVLYVLYRRASILYVHYETRI